MIMNMVAGGKTPSGTININTNGTYDVTDYASANVNVPDTVDTPVLLWTNANPLDLFAPQTVAVGGANYNAYIIECLAFFNAYDKYNTFINIGSNGYCGGETSGVNDGGLREISNTTATSVVFGSGYAISYGDEANVNNNYGIPQRIWGVKFTV